MVPEKLRPRKWSNAIRRRAFERTLAGTPLRPGDRAYEDVGTAYGGWMVPIDLVDPTWVCYTIGAGGDVSFDAALLERGATVRCFEPVEAFASQARSEVTSDRYSVHTVAIASADGPIRMQRTHHPGAQSVSASGLYLSDDFVEVPGRSLPSLMSEFGDSHIDLLKLDVEGLEYDLMPTVDLAALGVKVFSIQLHHNGGIPAARRLIAGVEAQGYRAAAMRPTVKLTFARDPL